MLLVLNSYCVCHYVFRVLGLCKISKVIHSSNNRLVVGVPGCSARTSLLGNNFASLATRLTFPITAEQPLLKAKLLTRLNIWKMLECLCFELHYGFFLLLYVYYRRKIVEAKRLMSQNISFITITKMAAQIRKWLKSNVHPR